MMARRRFNVPVAFRALSAVKVYESNFTTCPCGDEVVLVGSAEGTSRGCVRVELGRCPSCEAHQWALVTALTIPWECGMQAGMYYRRLREQVLAQLY
jgi:hypothetical protein